MPTTYLECLRNALNHRFNMPGGEVLESICARPHPDAPGPTLHLTADEALALRECLSATLDHLGIVDCDSDEDARMLVLLEGIRNRI